MWPLLAKPIKSSIHLTPSKILESSSVSLLSLKYPGSERHGRSGNLTLLSLSVAMLFFDFPSWFGTVRNYYIRKIKRTVQTDGEFKVVRYDF